MNHHKGCVRVMTAIGPGSGVLLSGGHDSKVIVSDVDRGTILFEITD